MIPASRPEGAKGADPTLVERVYDVISDWNLNARPLTHVDLAGRIATLCAEYAREQVEQHLDALEATAKEAIKHQDDARDLRAQLQTLRGENEDLQAMEAQLAACQEREREAIRRYDAIRNISDWHERAVAAEEAIRRLVSVCLDLRIYVPEGAPVLRQYVSAISNDTVGRAYNAALAPRRG